MKTDGNLAINPKRQSSVKQNKKLQTSVYFKFVPYDGSVAKRDQDIVNIGLFLVFSL